MLTHQGTYQGASGTTHTHTHDDDDNKNKNTKTVALKSEVKQNTPLCINK